MAVNDLDADRVASVVDEIGRDGATARPAPFDVTDYDAVQDAVGRLGPIDVAVNNAGNAGKVDTHGFENMRRFAEEDPEAWTGFLAVNLFGVMYVTRAVLPAMIDAGFGRVITIVSDTARVGEPYMAAYSAAKAGAAGLMRSIAREVGQDGVTVNSIALGTMNPTENDAEQEQQFAYLVKRYPVRRRGLPADVANLVTFLASDLSEWITAQTIPLNGGYSSAL